MAQTYYSGWNPKIHLYFQLTETHREVGWCGASPPKYLSNYIMLLNCFHQNPTKKTNQHPMRGPLVGHLLQSEKKAAKWIKPATCRHPKKSQRAEQAMVWQPDSRNIIQNLGKPPSPVEGVRLTQVKPCRTYLGILVSTFFFSGICFFGGGEQNM